MVGHPLPLPPPLPLPCVARVARKLDADWRNARGISASRLRTTTEFPDFRVRRIGLRLSFSLSLSLSLSLSGMFFRAEESASLRIDSNETRL